MTPAPLAKGPDKPREATLPDAITLPDPTVLRDVRLRLAAIRRAFLERSAAQVSALERINERLAPDQERLAPDRSAHAETLGTVHRLAGSAGTFGFVSIAQAAGALEDELREGGAAALRRALGTRLPALALAVARATMDDGNDETGDAP